MSRRRHKNSGCGCLSVVGLGLAVILLILIVGAIGILNDPAAGNRAGAWWLIGGASGFLLVLIVLMGRRPRQGSASGACQLCGSPIMRKFYNVTIDGRSMTVCGNCGRSIAAKISKKATDRLNV